MKLWIKNKQVICFFSLIGLVYIKINESSCYIQLKNIYIFFFVSLTIDKKNRNEERKKEHVLIIFGRDFFVTTITKAEQNFYAAK